MPQFFNLQRLILASAAFAILVIASSTTFADPITITVGNPNNQNTYNVLFNNSNLMGFANNPVPEPASLFLLGSGLVGTAGALRRRLRNRNKQD